eukprot:67141-Prymnesium_polylepis.1
MAEWTELARRLRLEAAGVREAAGRTENGLRGGSFAVGASGTKLACRLPRSALVLAQLAPHARSKAPTRRHSPRSTLRRHDAAGRAERAGGGRRALVGA